MIGFARLNSRSCTEAKAFCENQAAASHYKNNGSFKKLKLNVTESTKTGRKPVSGKL